MSLVNEFFLSVDNTESFGEGGRDWYYYSKSYADICITYPDATYTCPECKLVAKVEMLKLAGQWRSISNSKDEFIGIFSSEWPGDYIHIDAKDTTDSDVICHCGADMPRYESEAGSEESSELREEFMRKFSTPEEDLKSTSEK